MKLALIAIGLLTTISEVPPAFAPGGGMHSEKPWNPYLTHSSCGLGGATDHAARFEPTRR